MSGLKGSNCSKPTIQMTSSIFNVRGFSHAAHMQLHALEMETTSKPWPIDLIN
jgi:hypothetical protein